MYAYGVRGAYNARMESLYRETDAWAVRAGAAVLHGMSAEKLTTYRGGGVCERVYLPACVGCAAEFWRACTEEERGEVYILGGGSNTVMADGEVSRPVLLTSRLVGIERVDEDASGVYLRAECGAGVAALIAACRRYGCGGAEFLAGVPATVGGMVRMNAGAFGSETADILFEAEVADPSTGEVRAMKREEIPFGYRRGAEGFVLAATFRFPFMSAEEGERKRRGYLALRRKHQPRAPSCGSVFKRSIAPAGALIEEAGLKGIREGGAEISRVHAGFIVNVGGGSARDFLRLAELARARVEELFGIRLENEFEHLSDDLPF